MNNFFGHIDSKVKLKAQNEYSKFRTIQEVRKNIMWKIIWGANILHIIN